jgi:hypothetical protein
MAKGRLTEDMSAGGLLRTKGMNPGAMATTLSYLDVAQSYGF